MDRRAAWVLGIIFGGLFLCLFGFLFVLYLAVSSDKTALSTGGDRVGVVEVIGPIGDSKKTLQAIKDFGDDAGIKAVVLRIDSPGGAVGPSQEIYDAIVRLREVKKKPVIASMGSVAASGGYYIACAADQIYANPGTLTGSIGVIMQIPYVEGLLKWANVEMRTIKAGALKDSGSPFRQMTPEEQQYFEGMLADVHQQFIEAVAKGRKLSVDEVKPHADGRVFSGRQGKEWKMVDELGGFEAAVAKAGQLGKIKGEPELEYPKKERRLFEQIMGEEAQTLFRGTLKGAIEDSLGGGLQFRAPGLGTP